MQAVVQLHESELNMETRDGREDSAGGVDLECGTGSQPSGLRWPSDRGDTALGADEPHAQAAKFAKNFFLRALRGLGVRHFQVG